MKTLSLVILTTLLFSFSSQADVFCEDQTDGSVNLRIDTTDRENLTGTYYSGAFRSKISPVIIDYRGLKRLFKFKAGGLNFELNIYYGASPLDSSLNDASLIYSRDNSVSEKIRMHCSI